MSKPSDDHINQEALFCILRTLNEMAILLAFIAKDIYDKDRIPVSMSPAINCYSFTTKDRLKDTSIYTDAIRRILGLDEVAE